MAYLVTKGKPNIVLSLSLFFTGSLQQEAGALRGRPRVLLQAADHRQEPRRGENTATQCCLVLLGLGVQYYTLRAALL